jgi:ribulose-phosphate 3-epimerase
VQHIREAGCRAGVALCPSTPLAGLSELLQDIDLALCMTVDPGWGGQPFIATSPSKIARMREVLPPDVVLEVDGGVDASTVGDCLASGAGLWVAGSAVFGKDDPGAALRAIATAAERRVSR